MRLFINNFMLKSWIEYDFRTIALIVESLTKSIPTINFIDYFSIVRLCYKSLLCNFFFLTKLPIFAQSQNNLHANIPFYNKNSLVLGEINILRKFL